MERRAPRQRRSREKNTDRESCEVEINFPPTAVRHRTNLPRPAHSVSHSLWIKVKDEPFVNRLLRSPSFSRPPCLARDPESKPRPSLLIKQQPIAFLLGE